jgi:centractin
MPGGALEESSGSGSSTTLFSGKKLNDHRGAFILQHPMEHGMVQDWDAMERLWQHVYSKQALNVPPEDHPLLFTEAPLNPRSHREHLAEVFFETFRTPALYWSPPSVLSLYASGRTTGVVLDIGEGVTHAVPVYEGLALTHSVTRSNIAGRTVTKYLQHLLRRSGVHTVTTAEADFVQTIKHDACYLTPTPMPDDDKQAHTPYQLPDGQVIDLSSERYQAPNVLLDPTLLGSEELSVAEVLTTAIQKSDRDLRAKLYRQVVLAGGCTLLPGCGERLLYQVRQAAPTHVSLQLAAPPDRLYSAYVGGSILASLATFKSMWVSREQYEEHGTSILHARDY